MMTRPEVSRYFMRVRRVTEEFCQPLPHEDQVPQPIVDVSPPKWHMGHTRTASLYIRCWGMSGNGREVHIFPIPVIVASRGLLENTMANLW